MLPHADRHAFVTACSSSRSLTSSPRRLMRIRVDNGPEFIRRSSTFGMAPWRPIRLLPTDNAFAEPVQREVRNECLNTYGPSASTTRGSNARLAEEFQ